MEPKEAEPFLKTVAATLKTENNNNRVENTAISDNKEAQIIVEVQRTDSLVAYSEKTLKIKNKTNKSTRHRFTGIGLALLSCIAFSLSSLIIKYLKDYHPFTKSVWRFQGLLLPSILMMTYFRCWNSQPIFKTVFPVRKPENWKNIIYLLLRATAAFSSLILQFFALRYIPLADQMVIGSTQPVFVSVVAYFLLGEKCGVIPVVNCVLTIIGVGIVAKPPMLSGAESYDNDLLVGSGLALVSTLMSVISIILTRRLKHIHFTVVTFSFGLYSSIISLSVALVMNVFQFPQGESHLLIAILLACLVFVTQTSTTIALKYEQAGPVSLVKTSSIVFAFVWQYVFLNTIPDMFSLVGALIIVTAVILTTLRKWVGTIPADDETRRKYGFLLK